MALDRCLPLWGGIGQGGASVVTFHPDKKISVDEFEEAVKSGKLARALKSVNPDKQRGPWTVLTDNEGFLHSKAVKAALKKPKITLLHIPARSPDLNPVELFWSWLRKKLRRMDLRDC